MPDRRGVSFDWEADRRKRVVQLRIHACGRGVVEFRFEQGGQVIGGMALAYPQQGTMVGSPPRDVQNAEALQAAATALNAKLDEFCA